MKMSYDTIIIGHITIDVNVFPWGLIENVLGGAPTYGGFSLAALRREVGAVSKIGSDFPEKFSPIFSKLGVDSEGILITSGSTTTFENTYDEDGNREQTCKSVANSISPEDIPNSYRNNSKSFYISPVAGEVSPETIDSVKSEDNLVMLDPQGIFREINEEGKVEIRMPSDLEDYLKNVDIVKIGLDEFEAFDEDKESALRKLVSMGPEIAILSLGEDGCMILSDNEVQEIEGIDVKVEDTTGAGDVFGTTFLANYLETRNLSQSARFGVTAAGLKIRYKGPTGFAEREEIEEEL